MLLWGLAQLRGLFYRGLQVAIVSGLTFSSLAYADLERWMSSGLQQSPASDGSVKQVELQRRYAKVGDAEFPIADLAYLKYQLKKFESGEESLKTLIRTWDQTLKLQHKMIRQLQDVTVYEGFWEPTSRYVKFYIRIKDNKVELSSLIFRAAYFKSVYFESEKIQRKWFNLNSSANVQYLKPRFDFFKNLTLSLAIADDTENCNFQCENFSSKLDCQIQKAQCSIRKNKSEVDNFLNNNTHLTGLRGFITKNVPENLKTEAKEFLTKVDTGVSAVQSGLGLAASIATFNISGIVGNAAKLYDSVKKLFSNQTEDSHANVLTLYQNINDSLVNLAEKTKDIEKNIMNMVGYFEKLSEVKNKTNFKTLSSEIDQLKKDANNKSGLANREAGGAQCTTSNSALSSINLLQTDYDSTYKMFKTIEALSEHPDPQTCEELQKTYYNLIIAENALQNTRLSMLLISEEVKKQNDQSAALCHDKVDQLKSIDVNFISSESYKNLLEKHNKRMEQLEKPKKDYVKQCSGKACSISDYNQCLKWCDVVTKNRPHRRNYCINESCENNLASKVCNDYQCAIIFGNLEAGLENAKLVDEENKTFASNKEAEKAYYYDLSGYLRKIKCSSKLEAASRQAFLKQMLMIAKKQNPDSINETLKNLKEAGDKLGKICNDVSAFKIDALAI